MRCFTVVGVKFRPSHKYAVALGIGAGPFFVLVFGRILANASPLAPACAVVKRTLHNNLIEQVFPGPSFTARVRQVEIMEISLRGCDYARITKHAQWRRQMINLPSATAVRRGVHFVKDGSSND